jgi:cell division protein FtsB
VTETTKIKTPEAQNQNEQAVATKAPTKKSSRKSILALSILALGINSTAAVYTLSPNEFALPNISNLTLPDLSRLAEWLPQPKASEPTQDPTLAMLKDIRSAQEKQFATLQANNYLLVQNTALLQQDSIALASLRQSVDEQAGTKKISAQIADEHQDVKKVSGQISALTAKVDSLKNAMASDVTASISAKQSANRFSRARKKVARQPNPVGPISLGGAPLSLPSAIPAPQS